MVNVRIEDDIVVFGVQGLYQLWAFKSRLDVPRASVLGARHDPEAVRGWKEWRVPGTSVPGLLTAGTFYRDGQRIFWDVHDAANTVVVDLNDQDYSQLVIEVEDPAAVVAMLNAAGSAP